MNAAEYERMYRLEDSYWWFVGRHKLLHLLLEDLYGKPSEQKSQRVILDVGCGTGAISQRLRCWGRVVSTDFSELALHFSQRRGLTHLLKTDAMRLALRDAAFDLVVCMDVLEHLPNDTAALCEFFRVLKPGGTLIATVPAYPHLWGEHDLALMHYRRYLRKELAAKVEGAGFGVRKISHCMTFLYPVVAFHRRLLAKRPPHNPPQAAMPMVPKGINWALICLMALENRIARRVSLPVGLTILCVAQRSDVPVSPASLCIENKLTAVEKP